MPAATIEDLGLSTKTPMELEERRRAIIDDFRTKYKSYDDPNIPDALLNELAVITGTLRRKNAGPPKAEKKPKATSSKKMNTDDFVV